MIMVALGCRSAVKPGWYSSPHLWQVGQCSHLQTCSCAMHRKYTLPALWRKDNLPDLQTSCRATVLLWAAQPAEHFSATPGSIELRSSIWRANKQMFCRRIERCPAAGFKGFPPLTCIQKQCLIIIKGLYSKTTWRSASYWALIYYTLSVFLYNVVIKYDAKSEYNSN